MLDSSLIADFPDYDQNIFQFDPGDILTDAQRLQFKSGGDSHGVTEQLRSVRKWQPAFAGTVVIWQSQEGNLYIGDGHQRLGLATRLKTDVKERPSKLNGFLIKENEGWSVRHARIFCAIRNLAEGGESTRPADVAKVLRNGGHESLFHGFVSFFRKSFHLGKSLAKLGEEGFQSVIDGHYPEIWGAVVAERISDSKQQVAALNQIKALKHRPASQDELIEIVDEIARSGFVTLASQSVLFEGMEDYEMSLLEAKLDIIKAAKKVLKKSKTFKQALTLADEFTACGSPLQLDRIAARIDDLERMLTVHKKLARCEGEVSTILSGVAREYVEKTSLSRRMALTGAVEKFLIGLSRVTDEILPRGQAQQERKPPDEQPVLFINPDDLVQNNLFTYV